MARAIGAGVHSLAWKRDAGGFTSRAALFYLWNQLEQGTACPVTMTFASIPVFAHAPDLAREWRPRVLADAYDPRPLPLAAKAGVTVGMAMTEKQGGSDLRAVATVAATRRRRVAPHRPQVVLLGADERRVLHPRAHPRGRHLLLRAALARRRHAQRLRDPAPEGQGRQPLQRLLGDRVSRHARLAGGRAGARDRDPHRDGAPHALRHRGGRGGHDARGPRRGAPPCTPSRGVRQAARRARADGERARRPRARGRGGDAHRVPPRRRLRRARRRALPSGRCSASSRRSPSTGFAGA